MAEYALSYVIILVVLCNVMVIASLAAIVVLVPRMTRRRPAHRAEAATSRPRLSLVSAKQAPARRAAAPAARAA